MTVEIEVPIMTATMECIMQRLITGMMLLISLPAIAAEPSGNSESRKPVAAQSRMPVIQVECRGRLRHGLVAIGGETTGTTITIDRMVWELNLHNDATRKFATEHHKEVVLVAGSLRRVRGTAVAARWIVDVEKLSVPDHDTKTDFAKVAMTGVIRNVPQTDGKDSDHLVIEADEISFPLDFTPDPSMHIVARSLIREKALLKGLIERQPGLELPPKVLIRVAQLDKVK